MRIRQEQRSNVVILCENCGKPYNDYVLFCGERNPQTEMVFCFNCFADFVRQCRNIDVVIPINNAEVNNAE